MGVPQESVSMNLPVNGATADVQARRRGTHVPLAILEHAAQRLALRI
jgi:hypothetical protein